MFILTDWYRQIKALQEDDYTGMITIETHCQPLEKNFKIYHEELRKILNKLSK